MMEEETHSQPHPHKAVVLVTTQLEVQPKSSVTEIIAYQSSSLKEEGVLVHVLSLFRVQDDPSGKRSFEDEFKDSLCFQDTVMGKLDSFLGRARGFLYQSFGSSIWHQKLEQLSVILRSIWIRSQVRILEKSWGIQPTIFNHSQYVDAHYLYPYRVFYWAHNQMIMRRMAQSCASHYSKGREHSSLVALNESFREEIKERYEELAENILLIRNPFEHHRILEKSRKPLGEDVQGLISSRVQSNGFYLVLSVLVPVKRISLAIEGLYRSESLAHLFIVGNGPLRDELKHYVEDLNMTDRVHFLGYQDNPYPILREAKALLLTSQAEAGPFTALEAIVTETPVLGVDVPGVRDILSKIHSDNLCYTATPEAFAELIDRFEGSSYRLEDSSVLKLFSPWLHTQEIKKLL